MKEAHSLSLEKRTALRDAASLLLKSDVYPYLELKELLPKDDELSRKKLRSLFIRYYQMQPAHLNDQFLDEFFALLRTLKKPDSSPTVSHVLNKLPRESQKKNRKALQYSFASKLVATLDDTKPIWDAHVRSFFGLSNPSGGDDAEKIENFTGSLKSIECSYRKWARSEVPELIEQVRMLDERLSQVCEIRLLDFLVWKVGNEKLLPRRSDKS